MGQWRVCSQGDWAESRPKYPRASRRCDCHDGHERIRRAPPDEIGLSRPTAHPPNFTKFLAGLFCLIYIALRSDRQTVETLRVLVRYNTYVQKDLSASWPEYELLDSGEHKKLERFGEVILVRPETQAIWEKRKPEIWESAQAEFRFSGGDGLWEKRKAPSEWDVSWNDVNTTLELTNFKHVGVFPEQAPNWDWTALQLAALGAREEAPRVLHLFAYTGIASIVAARAGAHVTHVDASKHTLDWAHNNMLKSGLPEDAIRWIHEDVLQFSKREAKRGNTYDGIILDPPVFGRGAKGEVWHIEENLPELMKILAALLAPNGFLLLNGYAAGYTPTSFRQLVESHFAPRTPEYGELQIQESGEGRILSQGIYARLAVQ